MDAVPIGAGDIGAGEVVAVDLARRPCLPPLAAMVLIITNYFLLLSVHGNDGVSRPQRAFDRSVDMPELRVPIPMIPSFFGLPVALQTIARIARELSDLGMADPMAPGRQLRRQRPRALASPAQRGLGITARQGLNQAVQGERQSGVVGRQFTTSAARPANPARGKWRALQFMNAFGERDAGQAARAADQGNAAMAELHGFAGGHQAAGVLIQMRPDTGKILNETGHRCSFAL